MYWFSFFRHCELFRNYSSFRVVIVFPRLIRKRSVISCLKKFFVCDD